MKRKTVLAGFLLILFGLAIAGTGVTPSPTKTNLTQTEKDILLENNATDWSISGLRQNGDYLEFEIKTEGFETTAGIQTKICEEYTDGFATGFPKCLSWRDATQQELLTFREMKINSRIKGYAKQLIIREQQENNQIIEDENISITGTTPK